MSSLKICRICLNTDIKLYQYDRYALKIYYEEVTGTKVYDNDGLPQYFCYECAALLHKFYKFKAKCHSGQDIIKQLLRIGPARLKLVKCIRKGTKHLQSSLNIITVSQRVKTCVVKSKENPKLDTPESTEIDPETALISDNDDYIEAYNDEEELPQLLELADVDTKIEDDEEKIDGIDEKIDIDDKAVDLIHENIDIVHEKENINEENPIITEDILKLEKEFSDDDELVSDEDNVDNIKIPVHEKENIDEENPIITEDILKFEREFSDDDKLVSDEDNVDNIKIYVHEKENIDEENPIITEDILKLEREFSDGDKLVSDEDNVDNIKIPTDNEEIIKKESLLVPTKKKNNAKGSKNKNKVNDVETSSKRKKFEITDKKKMELDPKNWLKLNLSEEEALDEFKARALQKKFISANYKCNDCLKGFSKEDMLNRHRKLRHSESLGPMECRFCHMRFKHKCILELHMREHFSKFKCLRCERVCPLETTALFHDDYHNGLIRKCEHCNKEFKHISTYYTHLRTHRSEHVCTLCGASFVSAAGLTLHKKRKHIFEETEGRAPSEEEYCKRCDIKFESKKAFEKHLIHSAKHEDVEVQTLGRRSRKRQPMKKISTDCHICGKHFSTQDACRKHRLVQHPGSSGERTICEICGISILNLSVASHLNNHTREKLYTCDTCGKEFTCKTGLTKHLLRHSNVKAVACTLCDKRFKQKSSMNLHYRTFHLKEPYPKRIRKKKFDVVTKLDGYPGY